MVSSRPFMSVQWFTERAHQQDFQCLLLRLRASATYWRLIVGELLVQIAAGHPELTTRPKATKTAYFPFNYIKT